MFSSQLNNTQRIIHNFDSSDNINILEDHELSKVMQYKQAIRSIV